MARLPGYIDQGTPRGARPSGATVRPTDFGLGEVADAVGQVGQALEIRADKKAQRTLQSAQAEYESQFAERAGAYDGREPGFANAETGHFDAYFKGVTEKAGDLERYALTRRLDAYRAQAGARAIGVESERRGGIVAEHRAAIAQQNVSVGLTDFQALYGKAYQDLSDSYDGSTADFAVRAGAAADDALAMALENVPEAQHDAFTARVAGLKPGLVGQAMEVEAKRQQAYVVDKVKTAQARTTNTVIGNPEAFGLAFSTADEVVAGVPAALREPMVREYRGQLAAARVQGLILKGDLSTATAELEGGQYDEVLAPNQKVQLVEAVRGRSAKLAGDLIEAMRYGEDVDPDALKAAAKASGDAGLMGKADWALTVGSYEADALGSVAGGGARKGFAEAADFVIELEGGDATIPNDNGRGVSRFGINQTANPDVDVANLSRGQAVARYRKYWAAVGGAHLPPGLAIAAFDAAVLMGPDKARGFMAESGGDVGQFLALETAEMQRLAKADPGKYGDDLKGWLNRVEKVRGEAARRQAFANVQDGLSSDPIKFALGGNGRMALAQVAPMPEEPSGPAFQAALQNRAQVGALMAKQYRAPMRLLTDGEAAQFRDRITRNPQAALDLAEEAVAAVGPQAARSLMGEVGKQGEASLMVHLGDLAASGSTGFARLAVAGIGLKTQGSTLESDDKTALKAATAKLGNALQGLPELDGLVRQAAEAAMLADQGKQGASFYVQGALGATQVQGRTFGGVTEVNGRATVLPPWLAADRAEDAVERLAQGWAGSAKGPVHGDGTPYALADLRRARLALMPNGNYRLLDGRGAFMLGADKAHAFELDLDGQREALRGFLGAKGVR